VKKYSLKCPHCGVIPDGHRRSFIIVSTTEAKCWKCGKEFKPELIADDGKGEGVVKFEMGKP
jgi:DNA-directed RNA polymerase subunit RPC12/RpoP